MISKLHSHGQLQDSLDRYGIGRLRSAVLVYDSQLEHIEHLLPIDVENLQINPGSCTHRRALSWTSRAMGVNPCSFRAELHSHTM